MKRTLWLGILWLITIPLAAQQAPADVDEMPYFNGCSELKDGSARKRNASNRLLAEFIRQHLTYPDSAKAAGIEGTVYLRFVVDTRGRVTSPQVLYDPGYGLGDEALRILSLMPPWEPARQDGKPVAVTMELPIRFELKDDQVIARGYQIIWGDYDSPVLTKRQLRRLLDSPIRVLDPHGDIVDLLELKVAIVRKDKIIKERISDGRLSKAQKKIIRRARRHTLIELVGTIQKAGKFFFVRKEIKVR